MIPDSQWLNVQDVAEMLQIKSETVRRWIRRNELPVLELGGPRAGYRIRRDDLDHFIWQRYRTRNQNDAEQDLAGQHMNPSLRVAPATDEHEVPPRLISDNGDGDTISPPVDQPHSSLVRRIPGITYATVGDPESGESFRRRIVFISDSFMAALGDSARHLQDGNRDWWDLVHPDDRQRVQGSRRHSYRTGERLSIEYRIVPPGRDLIWVRDEAVLGDDGEGADPIWQGIVLDISDRKKVEETLQARVRQQEIITELGDHALQWMDIPNLLDEAARYVSQTLDSQFVKIVELQPGGDTLLLRAGVGWRASWIGKLTFEAKATSQSGYALLSNEPLIVYDLLEDSRFPGPSLLHDKGVRSGVSVIIAGQGKPYGVIGVHSKEVRNFTGDDVAFLQAVANVLASAVLAASGTQGGRWLSIRDIADTLRVKEETVRRWIRRGELPVVDLGSSRAGYRIHPVDLEHFISERYMKP